MHGRNKGGWVWKENKVRVSAPKLNGPWVTLTVAMAAECLISRHFSKSGPCFCFLCPDRGIVCMLFVCSSAKVLKKYWIEEEAREGGKGNLYGRFSLHLILHSFKQRVREASWFKTSGHVFLISLWPQLLVFSLQNLYIYKCMYIKLMLHCDWEVSAKCMFQKRW